MYCHYCKTKIDSDSLYCKHCGRQVVLDSEKLLRPRRRRRRPVAALLLIALLLGLAGGGYWALNTYMPDLMPALLEKVGIGQKAQPSPEPAQGFLPEQNASARQA